MNKLQLIKQTEYYVLICEVLFELHSVDFVKLCSMVFVVSQKKQYKHINDFFNIFGSNFMTRISDLMTIKECVISLEKNGIISIIDNKVTLIKPFDTINFDMIKNDAIDILGQVNSMSNNSFIRMVAQYV